MFGWEAVKVERKREKSDKTAHNSKGADQGMFSELTDDLLVFVVYSCNSRCCMRMKMAENHRLNLVFAHKPRKLVVHSRLQTCGQVGHVKH